MRKFIYIIPLLAIVFASCEKVIDIDVKDAQSQLVIEGTLDDQNGRARVKITKSVGLTDDNIFPEVNNATLILKDDAGNNYNLYYTQSGVYLSDTVPLVTGRKYTLTATVDGKDYVATSVMPDVTPFDSLGLDSTSFGGNVGYRWTPYHIDPAGVKNNYRYHFFVNGFADAAIYVDNDQYTDGRYVSRPFFSNMDMKSGDVLTVEMYNIDDASYLYWFSLSQSSEGPDQSATPANPVSNFSGGCLGYFSAQRKQVRDVVIP